jgi:hypothetical protein
MNGASSAGVAHTCGQHGSVPHLLGSRCTGARALVLILSLRVALFPDTRVHPRFRNSQHARIRYFQPDQLSSAYHILGASYIRTNRTYVGKGMGYLFSGEPSLSEEG